MSKYIIRLDDACERRDIQKWDRVEALLDKYQINPLVGVIPHCEDPMMEQYETDPLFWERVKCWEQKGWTIAMHGYNHVYSTQCGGINPVNKRSEFAGESLDSQQNKIKAGVKIFRTHGIDPRVFFAPAHTFDENTLVVLKNDSNIRFISDTIANNMYSENGLTFVPQQSGTFRALPFQMVTFCVHPNSLTDVDFSGIEFFFHKYIFSSFPNQLCTRRRDVYDVFLARMYFIRKRIYHLIFLGESR